jgi:hypothetical protein
VVRFAKAWRWPLGLAAVFLVLGLSMKGYRSTYSAAQLQAEEAGGWCVSAPNGAFLSAPGGSASGAPCKPQHSWWTPVFATSGGLVLGLVVMVVLRASGDEVGAVDAGSAAGGVGGSRGGDER